MNLCREYRRRSAPTICARVVARVSTARAGKVLPSPTSKRQRPLISSRARRGRPGWQPASLLQQRRCFAVALRHFQYPRKEACRFLVWLRMCGIGDVHLAEYMPTKSEMRKVVWLGGTWATLMRGDCKHHP